MNFQKQWSGGILYKKQGINFDRINDRINDHIAIASFTHPLHSAYFAQGIIHFPKIFLPIGSNSLPVQFKEDHL